MTVINCMDEDNEKKDDVQNIDKVCNKEDVKKITLLNSLDGEAFIQAVVMAELLGKPKAKRKKGR